MNFDTLEKLLIKTVEYTTESEFINCDSDEVKDGEKVFFTFFDTLGKQLGISNFAKYVLAKSHFSSGFIEAEFPISIRNATAREAVEKFIIQLDKASEAVDDNVRSLNDIESLDDYAGETPISNEAFSFANYQFNHYAFSINITSRLNVEIRNPRKATFSILMQIKY